MQLKGVVPVVRGTTAALRALLLKDEKVDVERVAEGVVWLACLASKPSAPPELGKAVDHMAAGMLGVPLTESRTRLVEVAEQVLSLHIFA